MVPALSPLLSSSPPVFAKKQTSSPAPEKDPSLQETIVLHKRDCFQWHHIPTDRLVEYAQFSLQTLSMKRLHCQLIQLIHEFYRANDDVMPISREEIAHFHQHGTIPTRNLHLLTPQLFVTSSSSPSNCALCGQGLHEGDLVFPLSCEHVCCASRFSPSCDTIGWLRMTNQCPQCRTTVKLEPKRV